MQCGLVFNFAIDLAVGAKSPAAGAALSSMPRERVLTELKANRKHSSANIRVWPGDIDIVS